MKHQLDIFDNGSASQVGERQTDLEDLIAEVNETLMKENARKLNAIDAAGGLYHVRKYANAWVPVAIVNNCRHTGSHCGTSYDAMRSAIDLCERLSVEALGLMNPP